MSYDAKYWHKELMSFARNMGLRDRGEMVDFAHFIDALTKTTEELYRFCHQQSPVHGDWLFERNVAFMVFGGSLHTMRDGHLYELPKDYSETPEQWRTLQRNLLFLGALRKMITKEELAILLPNIAPEKFDNTTYFRAMAYRGGRVVSENSSWIGQQYKQYCNDKTALHKKATSKSRSSRSKRGKKDAESLPMRAMIFGLGVVSEGNEKAEKDEIANAPQQKANSCGHSGEKSDPPPSNTGITLGA